MNIKKSKRIVKEQKLKLQTMKTEYSHYKNYLIAKLSDSKHDIEKELIKEK